MAKLTEHLRFFICKKIQERHWEECFAFGKIELHCPLKTNCKLQSYWMLLVYSINECSFLDAAGCKHCASRDRKIQPGNALQWSFLVQRHLVRGNTRLWITSAKPRRSSYMLQPQSPQRQQQGACGKVSEFFNTAVILDQELSYGQYGPTCDSQLAGTARS